MKISASGVLEIAEHEGIVLAPYMDSVGVWTYGIGHTRGAGAPDPARMPRHDTRGWSQAQVNRELARIVKLFDEDLDSYEARVNGAIKVPLRQHQFDALVSFDFNTGGILRAKLTSQINAGDTSGTGFMGWLRPPEIKARRTAEMNLFRSGRYDANGDRIAVYDALGDGRMRFRQHISGKEFAALMGARPAKPAGQNTIGRWLYRVLEALNIGGRK